MKAIEVKHISKYYGKPGQEVVACKDISFDIYEGETLGLVGESGSGKTTLGHIILGMEEASEGEIIYSQELQAGKDQGQAMQIIFQDPLSALNPWQSALEIVMEPLLLLTSKKEAEDKAHAILEQVGIAYEYHQKRPQFFSGGQRQRIGIARSVVTDPAFILCDEPVSALDVSIQATIINLLKDIQAARKITYLFISHDLSIVRAIADRIVVLYRGHVVEIGQVEEIYEGAVHPYTKDLLASIPIPDPIQAKAFQQRISQINRANYYVEGQWTSISPTHQVLMPKAE